MPTYEYTCEACSAGWEQEQRSVDAPIKVCPKCGEPKEKRLISVGNFLLKGDGWYKDLYHKPAAKKASADKSTDSSGSSAASPSSTSDSSSTSKSTETSSSSTKSEGSSTSGSSKPSGS